MKIKRFDQINVIPFIDIMLVLLVIVLTTASFIAKGIIPLDLPKAGSGQELPVKRIEISIDREGKLFLGGERVGLEELRQKLASISLKSTILLRTDKNSRFQSFITVLDLLKSRGFEKIDLETER
ncbi:MAG: biopolymer transporter ExbD [Epsilonproteobacteria bacterium]|nr:TonB system transport protein ExbD [Campylobacterota bacterium]NPA56922.1 biopolymer transporter ExbD [Campylobacterota bacterium]